MRISEQLATVVHTPGRRMQRTSGQSTCEKGAVNSSLIVERNGWGCGSTRALRLNCSSLAPKGQFKCPVDLVIVWGVVEAMLDPLTVAVERILDEDSPLLG